MGLETAKNAMPEGAFSIAKSRHEKFKKRRKISFARRAGCMLYSPAPEADDTTHGSDTHNLAFSAMISSRNTTD